MSQGWTIIDSTTGAVLHAYFVTPSYGSHPKDNGWAWDAATQTATRVDAAPDPVVEEFDPVTRNWRQNLTILRETLRAKVDAEAELVRLRFITPGAGQAMEYQEAYDQARAYQADPGGSYPMVQADVDAGTIDPRTGLAVATLADGADLIIWMHMQWKVAGAVIRAARLAAKAAITAAETLPELIAAGTVDWDALTS